MFDFFCFLISIKLNLKKNMKNFTSIFILSLIFFFNYSKAQSVYTIDNTQPTAGTNFTNFTDAVEFLDTLSSIPIDGIIFNVTAEQIFNETYPISILNRTGSPIGNIVFQKSGSGENPVIKYDSPTNSDSIVRIINSSFIVWDAIDITDADTTNDYSPNTALRIRGSHDIEIKNSKIYNYGKYGLFIDACTQNFTIENNQIFYDSTYFTPTVNTFMYGIYINNTGHQQNYQIKNNVLYGFKKFTSNLYAIRIKNTNTIISNNFISITADSNQQIQTIRLDLIAGQEVKVYNNTILLEGVGKKYTNNPIGTCLYITNSNPAPDATTKLYAYNNIFINKRTIPQETTAEQTNINMGATNITYYYDYNLYQTAKTDSMFIKFGSIGYYTIEAWNSFSNKDLNSTISTVSFVDKKNGDLHIAPIDLGKYKLAGNYLAEVPTDIDGEPRATSLPYKGADENTTYPIDIAISANIDTIDFGQINRLDSLCKSIKFSKSNSVIGKIDSLVSTSDFYISLDSINWTQKITDISINNGQEINIFVLFNPQNVGLFDEILNAYLSNDFIIKTKLLGQGMPRGFTYTPSQYNFGYIDIGAYSDTIPLKLINEDTIDITINSIYCPDGYYAKLQGAEEFVQNIGQFSIPVNKDTTIYIFFHPTVYKDYTDSIEIEYSDFTNFKVIGYARAVNINFFTLGQGVNLGDAAFGDYNNDGLLDIAYIGFGIFKITGEWIYTNGRSFLYKNNGNFDFEKQNIKLSKYANSAISWVDYDNNGWVDLFMSGRCDSIKYTGNDSSVVAFFKTTSYKNTNGTLTEFDSYITPLEDPSLDWADYNLDGKIDLIMTGKDTISGGQYLTFVYKNEGTNGFFVEHTLEGISGEAKWGDYNNDGYPDIALTGKSNINYKTQIYKNINGTDFQLVYDANPGLRYSRIDWGDYDNDGDIDLLNTGTITNEEDAHGYIYKNEGNDNFTQIQLPLGCKQGDSKWIDIDNDGDLDIIVNGLYQYTYWVNHILQNNSGNFDIVYADTSKALENSDITIGDLNGDYSTDYLLLGKYLPGDNRAYIYQNNYSILNSVPTAPTNLNVTLNGNYATFTWNPATDLQTPSQSLTYNLKIGTASGLGDAFNSHTIISTPTRLIPQRGNVGSVNSVTIKLPLANTYYASVQAIDNSFIPSDWSNEVIFNILVDNKENKQKQLIVYPNPASDFIYIDTRNFKTPCIQIINNFGQIVYKTYTKEIINKINITDLPSGLYFIKIIENQTNIIQKFIIK